MTIKVEAMDAKRILLTKPIWYSARSYTLSWTRPTFREIVR